VPARLVRVGERFAAASCGGLRSAAAVVFLFLWHLRCVRILCVRSAASPAASSFIYYLPREGCLFWTRDLATRAGRLRLCVAGSHVGLAAQRRGRGRATLLWRRRAASRTGRAGLDVVLPGPHTECRRQVQVQRSAERRDPEAASHRQHLARARSRAWSERPFGSALARLLRLLRARLTAAGSSALRWRGQPT
jgi:hypothetical protein